jgi:hypothetical protein
MLSVSWLVLCDVMSLIFVSSLLSCCLIICSSPHPLHPCVRGVLLSTVRTFSRTHFIMIRAPSDQLAWDKWPLTDARACNHALFIVVFACLAALQEQSTSFLDPVGGCAFLTPDAHHCRPHVSAGFFRGPPANLAGPRAHVFGLACGASPGWRTVRTCRAALSSATVTPCSSSTWSHFRHTAYGPVLGVLGLLPAALMLFEYSWSPFGLLERPFIPARAVRCPFLVNGYRQLMHSQRLARCRVSGEEAMAAVPR